MTPETFFAALWRQYIELTPQAARIHGALKARGETVLNDHVAFRTFNLAPMRLQDLEPHLLAMGYERLEPYQFPGKHLDAWGYLPKTPELPRVFLSELRVEALPEDCQAIIKGLVEQVDPTSVNGPEFFYRGLPWALPTAKEYLRLAEVSEYAAWMSVMGMRANHFTLAVHRLRSFDQLSALNEFVKQEVELPLNTAGGEIKGGAEVYLAQSSTLADECRLRFRDGTDMIVPTCFYEFAQRFRLPDGSLYQGFVANNADRIFESTNRRRA